MLRKVIDKPEKFLGVQFVFSEDDIHLNQEEYVTYLLKRFHMTGAKHVKKPMEHNVIVTTNTGATTEKPFRSLIGALSYLSAGTRPDI